METLPQEMVLKVFDFLDADSLKTTSTVCKYWRNSIFKSHEKMNNFTLIIHNFEEQKSFLKEHGMSFRNVRIASDTSTRNPGYNQNNFVELLSLIRNVETLEIGKIKMTFRTKRVVEMNLPNLKNVKLCNSANTYRVSNFFGSTKLKEIIFDIEKTSNCFDIYFRNWLCDQDQLRSIKFLGSSLELFLQRLEYNVSPISFKLKKLDFKMDGIQDEASGEALVNFLRQQNEIEELILDRSMRGRSSETLNTRILQQILQIHNNLRHLEIHGAFWFRVEDIQRLENRSLETLVYKTYLHERAAELIKRVPNLRILDINVLCSWDISHNTLKNFCEFISANAPNLEVLRILKSALSEKEDYSDLRLPNLREFSLDFSSINYTNWKSIVEKCPNIEKIKLGHFVFSTQSFHLICQQLKNLKYLELGCGVYPRGFLDHLNICAHFRRLTLSPRMRAQFNEFLENADFEVAVKKISTNSGRYFDFEDFIDFHDDFKRRNQQVSNFFGFLNNFQDFPDV